MAVNNDGAGGAQGNPQDGFDIDGDGTADVSAETTKWLDDFFADSNVNWRNAVKEASIIFQDYNENVSKQLAFALNKLKDANTELRILTEAQDTVSNLKKKLEKIALSLDEDNNDPEKAQNLSITTDYNAGADDASTKPGTSGDAWAIRKPDGTVVNPNDIPAGSELTDADIEKFQKAIAAIRYYSRDTESGELSLKAGQDKIDDVFGTEETKYEVDLEDLRALEGILDNQVESLSPLTTQLANKSQAIQTQSQTATAATSQFIELIKTTILPFFQK